MGIVSWAATHAARWGYGVYSSVSDQIAKERRIRLTDRQAGAMLSDVYGQTGAAGKAVTVDSAMRLSAFAACVRATTQAVASMPLPMYERTSGNGRVGVDHPLSEIISGSPNIDQTALEFWETTVAWMMTVGNACSEISRGYRDRVTALSILPGCQPVRDPKTNELVFQYVDRGKLETLPRDKVFHVKGFGFDKDRGVSVIRYGVESLSTSLAAQEVTGKLFSNGMQASGILSSDQSLKPPQREQLQKVMEEYIGSDKAGKLMILEAGLTYKGVTLSPADAQLLEQQRFQIEDVCRWCGTPPIIIGHSPQGQTMWGSGVEQILIGWLQTGINPIANRIERRIQKQLLSPGEQARFYAEFNREAFLQMDSKAKASFLSSMTQNGLMTRNEGRAKLNLPNSDDAGADQLTAQTSLAPLGSLGANGQTGQHARAALLAWLGISEGGSNEPAKPAKGDV